MEFKVPQAIEILERTPAVLDAQLSGLSPVWLESRIDPDSFSPIDVLGHLIFGEITDWIPRIRIMLESGTSRTFDPFDRRGFTELIEEKSVEELLQQFTELRRESLDALRELALDDKLDLRGSHPGLGEVTMRQFLASWVVHDLGHIAQITRILAKQYRQAVGPWTEYLTILS